MLTKFVKSVPVLLPQSQFEDQVPFSPELSLITEIDSESQPDQLEVDPDEAAHIQQQYEDHLVQQNDQDAFDFEEFYSGYQGMFWMIWMGTNMDGVQI